MSIRQSFARATSLALLAAVGLAACTSVDGGYVQGGVIMYPGYGYYGPYYHGGGYYRPPTVSPRPPPVRPMNPIYTPPRPMPMPMPMPRPAMPSRR